VDQHAVGHRVVVADDAVDQLVDELVRVEAEGRHGIGDRIAKEVRTGRVRVRAEPRGQAVGDAGFGRHAAETALVHHALALGNRELPEQEEPLARRGRNPVRVAAPRVEECVGRLPGGGLGQLDQLVLDLERAEPLVIAEIDG
jgi:hypothetical protein